MLHITSLRTIAIGVSSLGLAAAGIAISVGSDGNNQGPATAGAHAGRTATAQADTSDLGALAGTRTLLKETSVDAAFGGPAPAARTTDRPTTSSATAPRATSAQPSAQKPLLSADIEGPVTVHVTTDEIVGTVNTTLSSTVKTVNNTVGWAKTTVDRTVQSLPVKATVTNGKGGTDVTVEAVGTSASAHIPR